MKSNFISKATDNICQLVISEYDSDLNKALCYGEFLNLVLPADNEGMKKYVLYHKKKTNVGVTKEIIMLLTRIIDQEKVIAFAKIEARNKLRGIDISKLFNELVCHKGYITCSMIESLLGSTSS